MSKMPENMTDLPDVAKVTNGMGGVSARQSRVVSVLDARAFTSISCLCRFLLLVC